MHVTVTRVRTGDVPIETATIVGQEMHRWLRDLDGFEGFLVVSREGTSLGLTFWESAEVAERYRQPRDEFRERMLSIAGAEIEEVIEYEVTFAHLPALLLGGDDVEPA
jgi:hypothetical protein